VATVTIPMRLPSAANLREHWAKKAKRVADQRRTVGAYLGGGPRPTLPVEVTLTRIAPRALDGDNLQHAFKGTRDEVARWLSVDDADPRVTWTYRQRKGGVGVQAVEVRLERVGARP
jgi:hypothetical protein